MNGHQKVLDDTFRYYEEGQGPTMILLHGLFGDIENWKEVSQYFSKSHRVIIPVLPIIKGEKKALNKYAATVKGVMHYVRDFIEVMGLENICLIGNSLGGHIALLYTIEYPQQVKYLVLTGSSGLYENTMGTSYVRRKDYEYIRLRVLDTFYDGSKVNEALPRSIYEICLRTDYSIRIIKVARDAMKHNLSDVLSTISVPTLLIWGLNDTITPPFVGHEFHRKIPHATLLFLDKCCHVPMMEHHSTFNDMVALFLATKKEKIIA